MGIGEIIPAFISSFRARGNEDEFSFKSITGGDDLYTDEEGRHLIFRNIKGKVRPIRVGAEEYAEWLANQNVDIDPADQKTLREIDKELEIMERAAEYGGAALQKKYEDYFKEKREKYKEVAQQYYQQAIKNQAKANNVSEEDLLEKKKQFYEQGKDDIVSRESMERRGWDSAFRMWVDNQDDQYNLTPESDSWYYNRLYGTILTELISKAEEGVSFSDLNMDEVFSTEFISQSLKNHYGDFFVGQEFDPKKVVGAVKSLQKYYKSDKRDNREALSNFVGYWYNRMENDFAKERDSMLGSAPETEGVIDVPDEVVPEELPKTFNGKEADSLISLYNRASGSKLNASHRVILHGMGRMIESIPEKDQVKFAVALADGSKGLHAAHKEGYQRAFTNHESLGMTEDREDLMGEALRAFEKAGKGSTTQKIAAMKKAAMLMGLIDGNAVLDTNPGVGKTQFSRKWHTSAMNAGRARSEGPGLIDFLTDESKRNAHIYTNKELRLIYDQKKQSEEPAPEEIEEKPQQTRTVRDDDREETFGDVDLEESSFRVPVFDFTGNLTNEDRNLTGDIVEEVGERGLAVRSISDNVYRVTNPENDKFIDVIFNTQKKQLMMAGRDEDGKIVPYTQPSMDIFNEAIN